MVLTREGVFLFRFKTRIVQLVICVSHDRLPFFLASGKLGQSLLQEQLQHVQHLYERLHLTGRQRNILQRYVEQSRHLRNCVCTGERQIASRVFLFGSNSCAESRSPRLMGSSTTFLLRLHYRERQLIVFSALTASSPEP